MKRKLNNILIIDDDEISNFLMVEILQKLSITKNYKFLNNGKEGLDYIIKSFSNINQKIIPPDLIFLDYRMPVMDGKEFIENLNKKNLQYFHWFNIILISTSIRNKDKEYFQNLGVKGFLEKPITEEKILDVITRIKPINNLTKN